MANRSPMLRLREWLLATTLIPALVLSSQTFAAGQGADAGVILAQAATTEPPEKKPAAPPKPGAAPQPHTAAPPEPHPAAPAPKAEAPAAPKPAAPAAPQPKAAAPAEPKPQATPAPQPAQNVVKPVPPAPAHTAAPPPQPAPLPKAAQVPPPAPAAPPVPKPQAAPNAAPNAAPAPKPAAPAPAVAAPAAGQAHPAATPLPPAAAKLPTTPPAPAGAVHSLPTPAAPVPAPAVQPQGQTPVHPVAPQPVQGAAHPLPPAAPGQAAPTQAQVPAHTPAPVPPTPAGGHALPAPGAPATAQTPPIPGQPPAPGRAAVPPVGQPAPQPVQQGGAHTLPVPGAPATAQTPALPGQPPAPGRPAIPAAGQGVPPQPIQQGGAHALPVPGAAPGQPAPVRVGQPPASPPPVAANRPAPPPPPPPPPPPAPAPTAAAPAQPVAGQPANQQARKRDSTGAIVAGAAAGFVGGFLAAQGFDRIDQVRGQRQEFTDDGVDVIREPGRTIVRQDNQYFIAHDENQRFRDLGYDVQTQRQGDYDVAAYDRPDGSRIFTYTDDQGRLVRRVRQFPDGREVFLIDNSYTRRDRAFEEDVITLPPPPDYGPQDRYIVDAGRADERLVYDTLVAPPVAPVQRRYTLDQVRYSPDLRARMRSVDVNTITFDSGSWTVAPEQAGRLAGIAQAVNAAVAKNPQEVFMLEGYTDAVGSDVDNLSLSDRRAQSVAAILTRDFQVPAENLVTQGYGEQFLKVQTQDASAENRRVTVRRITPLLAQQGK